MYWLENVENTQLFCAGEMKLAFLTVSMTGWHVLNKEVCVQFEAST